MRKKKKKHLGRWKKIKPKKVVEMTLIYAFILHIFKTKKIKFEQNITSHSMHLKMFY